MRKTATPPAYQPCFYRVSAKAIILSSNKLLLVREPSKGMRWDLPGGGIEHHEDLENALQRELTEELNLKQTSVQQDSMEAWFTYDYDPSWERPILNLIVNVTIPSKITGLDIVPGAGVEFSLFTKEELETLALEKNIEEFRTKLMRRAFKNV